MVSKPRSNGPKINDNFMKKLPIYITLRYKYGTRKTNST